MKARTKVIRELAEAFHGLARPYLTILIATMFNIIAAWAWYRGDLGIVEYLTAIGPTNGLIIGFWFGERAALKMPYNPCGPGGHGGFGGGFGGGHGGYGGGYGGYQNQFDPYSNQFGGHEDHHHHDHDPHERGRGGRRRAMSDAPDEQQHMEGMP